jgi:subtilisin family serine protease
MSYLRLPSLFALFVAITFVSCTDQFLENGEKLTPQNASIQLVDPVVVVNKVGIPDDSYIVVFKDSITTTEFKKEVAGLEKRYNAIPDHVYSRAIKGFAARLSPDALVDLRRNPMVEFIEKDQEVSLNATVTNVPSWGIDRIDQANLPLSYSYTYYNSGLGVKAYVIDTGILLSHSEFGGRAIGGFSSINTTTDWIDGNGHGTHVAGTIGGLNYGVAKDVTLVAVRVLDANGSGTNSGVIAGIDWAIADHVAGQPAVANMSLGGGASSALDLAVERAITDGIVMCVAAGNNSLDAGRYSPARVKNAITVGATGRFTTTSTSYDAIASYSNYGSVVDIFAPGTSINSAYIGDNNAIRALSGTSMATPHVTGVVAQYLSGNTSKTPAEVQTYIKTVATPRKVTGIKSTTTTTSLLYTNN